MKKAIILAIILTVTTFSLFAQMPPHPPDDAGSGGGPIGSPSGAPIDGGLSILLAMGALYGGKKIYTMKKDEK